MTEKRSQAQVNKILPKDVRAAKAFLKKRGVRGLPPRMFHRASEEIGASYQVLLDKLAGVARRSIE